MSLVLGIIGILSILYAGIVSYLRQGEIPDRFGAALFVTLLLEFVGLLLGGLAHREADKLQTIPTVGLILNCITVLALGFFLWIGLN